MPTAAREVEPALARVRGKVVGVCACREMKPVTVSASPRPWRTRPQARGELRLQLRHRRGRDREGTRRGGPCRRAALPGRRHRLCPRQLWHRLPAPLGIELPVYPVKGYSLTLPMTECRGCPAQHCAGRDLQGRHHPLRRTDPGGRHGRTLGLQPGAQPQTPRYPGHGGEGSLPQGEIWSRPPSGPGCAP